MRKLRARLPILAGFLLLLAESALGQVPTGIPPFSSADRKGFDSIDLANLNVQFAFPVISKPGRGLPFNYRITYDNSVWYPVGVSGSQNWQPVGNWGWRGQTEIAVGYVSYQSNQIKCFDDPSGWYWGTKFTAWVYHDYFGVSHTFSGLPVLTTCITGTDSASAVANDDSGYTISAGLGSAIIYSRSGQTINAPTQTTSGNGTATDSNGNQITISGSTFTDTLGQTALTVSGAIPNPVNFQYTSPAGTQVSVTLNYTSYSVETNFGCSGIAEYGPTNNYLVSSVTLPDQTSYTISYEPTPGYSGKVTGRMQSITLPTGGTISYSYTGGNNGITCADGSTAGLTRTTPDGTWTYARTPGTGAAYTTTVTDPQNNQTVIQFQGIYETQRDAYQGAISPSNLLGTTTTCYNGNTSNCTSTAITLPISQRNITTALPGGLQSEHDDFWNTYGMPSEADDYDYGSAPHGPLLKKTLATYAALGNNIHAFRQSVTVQDGQGHTMSQTNYNYDETGVVATSGTPQHVPVAGFRGNLTSVNYYVQASTFLSRVFSFYDTGKVQSETDVNGAVTAYNYSTGSCGNSFATSINLPLNLTRSTIWNCTGGVQTSSTGENGQVTTTAYSDPYFWRPASVTDPANAVTNMTYTSVTQTETSLTFNSGNSAVDTVTTLDSLGRVHLTQTRQAPGSSNFDTVETDYDSLGRISRVTLPYSGTLGQTNSSAPATTTTYDGLGRPLSISDTGGGSTTYSYTKNDILVTLGPAPQNEITKKRQLEYDASGRLTSLCELTSGTGSGTCSQATTQTGYWTKYTFDPMGNLLTVTQNAQASGSTQTRTYTYDMMGRLVSENNPESGLTRYLYDSDTDTPLACSGTYSGDQVKRVDAVGNITCSTYDAFHRQLSTTYPSGSYASVTPKKYFVYDGATVNGQAMSNPKNRLAEAYTCVSSCTSKITDIGMSYSGRGEVSDVYESTPNSNGYYHASALYWENGAPKQLSGLTGLPTISYTPDGEGRAKTVSASTGQSPLLTNATYNPASLPAELDYGSGLGDKDTFSYDSNTNRMTQYQFTVNSQSLTGALSWNASGTLKTQNITDVLNSADTQNCAYLYDDLTRLQSANCGSVWSQTFSYDPFGNINKAGSMSFQPTYTSNPPTNRIQSLPGNPPFTVQYDVNGNVLNDNFHTYTWDSEGRPVTIDSASLTYDALGRMVEQNRSGVYTQIVYSPTDRKLALMSSQTLQKAIVPLGGNSLAVYNASGLLYYGHGDFLGSVRLGTTPARAMYFDVAYAPFGETYAQSGSVDPAYTGQRDDTAQRQDTAGGLYDFPLREYSTQGRWPSPDPLGRAAACPKDPQTQNRYAYVRNNPLSYTDPLGALMCEDCDDEGGGCDPFWDPFCQCDPFFDPFCGGGFTGGGGGGGEPGPPPHLPLSVIPLGFFSALEGASPAPTGTLWDCLRDYKKPTYFGICAYGCTTTKLKGVAAFLFGTARLSRDCKFPVTNTCPYFVLVRTSTPVGVQGLGLEKIVSCQQEPH